jgi:limonene-1,2-epoxide hydrolase
MTPIAATSDFRTTTEPAEIVRSFLLALEAGELDEALELLADDVVYTNVSLPTIRGRARIGRLFRPALEKLHGGFRVHFHTIATSGSTVLTERTDALILGPVEQRVWVYGRFDVNDGRITLWRDSFDWLDVLVGLIRGLAGALIPALNRPWPGDTAQSARVR